MTRVGPSLKERGVEYPSTYKGPFDQKYTPSIKRARAVSHCSLEQSEVK